MRLVVQKLEKNSFDAETAADKRVGRGEDDNRISVPPRGCNGRRNALDAVRQIHSRTLYIVGGTTEKSVKGLFAVLLGAVAPQRKVLLRSVGDLHRQKAKLAVDLGGELSKID